MATSSSSTPAPAARPGGAGAGAGTGAGSLPSPGPSSSPGVETALYEIEPMFLDAEKTFHSGVTRSLSWRRKQLVAARKMVVDNRDSISAALHADLARPKFEAAVGDILGLVAEVDFMLAHLEEWAAPEAVATPLVQQPARSRIVREPKGVVLVLGAWNFPVLLTLLPGLAAIAAGNCVVLKPSEMAPASSRLVASLVPKYLDTAAIKIVQGGVSQSTTLLSLAFAHIFYTGGASVGTVVMKAAARNLTPTTLELGGKSPVIVAADANIAVTARRIASSKFLNAGQVCIAPDYVLVEASVEEELVRELIATVKRFYGDDPKASPDFGRIVNTRHWSRLKRLLTSHAGEVAIGGDVDSSQLYIAPTILRRVALDSAVMKEEIFGPLLPVIPVASVNDAISFVNREPFNHPLAAYCFSSSKATQDRVTHGIPAGGVCINDTIMHHANPNLPFGGIGPSGMGAYHGKYGFDTFSHRKAVLVKPTWIDPSVRYPPYDDRTLGIVSFLIIGNRFRIPGGKKSLVLVLAALLAAFMYVRRRMRR